MSAAHLSPQEQVKEYYKVFGWLVVLTVVEIAAVKLADLGVPKLIVTLVIVVLSCSKAVLVGYYYMHLKHEPRWIKIVALLPIIAFAYALVLGADYKIFHDRHAPHTYMYEPERKYPDVHQDVIDEVYTLEEEPMDGGAGTAPPASEHPVDSAAPPAAPAEAAPAAGGGDWN